MVRVATPPARVAVPRGAGPLRNVTVPVGMRADADTVAVNVTVCPKLDGLMSEARLMGGPGQASVVRVWSRPLVVPVKFAARARKWYSVPQWRPTPTLT